MDSGISAQRAAHPPHGYRGIQATASHIPVPVQNSPKVPGGWEVRPYLWGGPRWMLVEEGAMGARHMRQMSRPARVVRGLWPDRNPLRRPSDRLEAGMLFLLIVTFVLGTPFVALIAWRLSLGAVFTTVEAQHAGWRQVPAVLQSDAPSTGYYEPLIPATWTAPNGARCEGRVYASAGARAGTTTPIWVNASGRQVAWPMSPVNAANQADVVAAITVSFWGLILCVTGMFGRHLIDRRRMAAWDADLRAAKLTGPADASP